MDQAGRAVDQVAPAGHELVVGPADELGPGEVGVLVLRAGRGDEVAQGVRLVAVEDVTDVDHDAAAGGELLALHGQELRRHHLGRQLELAVLAGAASARSLAVVAEQLGRPDLGVEGDVVLAHEVIGASGVVVPPLPPGVGVAAAPGPLDRRRQVADDGVEPDVEALVGVVLPARQRHRDAPVDVAGHRPGSQVLEQVEAELQHVRAPEPLGLLAVQPLAEGVGQCRQVEEEVLGLDELRHLAVDPAARLDQVGRVELVAAVVALVAASVRVPADRAGALDVAVGQGATRGRADGALGRLLDHVTVAVQRPEELLGHCVVVAGRRPGEEVVGQPERVQVLDDHPVVAVGELSGRDALLLGLDQDRGAVLVGAADHQDVVAGHPHVPAEDVGGHAETGDVADVARAVGIRPGDGGQDMTHAASLVSAGNPFCTALRLGARPRGGWSDGCARSQLQTEQFAGGTAQSVTDRRERAEADCLGMAVLEDGKVRDRYADAGRQLDESHPVGLEKLVEVDCDPMLRGHGRQMTVSSSARMATPRSRIRPKAAKISPTASQPKGVS